METITEDYCSFEIAKLLKEKGFNEKCRAAYISYGQLFTTQIQQYITNILCSKGYLWDCTAPTHQMAIKWLRKVHNIIINPEPVWNGKKWEYQLFIITPQNANSPYYEHNPYKSYEKCVEVGIKYSLENLI